MTTSKTKTCQTCGATFNRSRADRTVNCPSCRQSAQQRPAADQGWPARDIRIEDKRGRQAWVSREHADRVVGIDGVKIVGRR